MYTYVLKLNCVPMKWRFFPSVSCKNSPLDALLKVSQMHFIFLASFSSLIN